MARQTIDVRGKKPSALILEMSMYGAIFYCQRIGDTQVLTPEEGRDNVCLVGMSGGYTILAADQCLVFRATEGWSVAPQFT